MSLLILLACADPPITADDVAPLAPASKKVTFATVEELGSHRLDATIDRTNLVPDQDPVTTKEVIAVRWQDPDHWQARRSRDGAPIDQIVVWDHTAWEAVGKGPLVKRGDAEPYRVQLASTWDPWKAALESAAERLTLTATVLEDVDGRRAWRHAVSFLPLGENVHANWRVTAADGEVWIDERTAVRLVGKVNVASQGKDRSREVLLQFAVSRIGQDVGVVDPTADDALTPPP